MFPASAGAALRGCALLDHTISTPWDKSSVFDRDLVQNWNLVSRRQGTPRIDEPTCKPSADTAEPYKTTQGKASWIAQMSFIPG